MSASDQKLLSIKEVASVLGMGKTTVWRLTKNGDLPQPIKIGGSTRWVRSDIEKLFNRDVA